jgi:cytochrome c oxidase cbb3-type subunit 2
MRAALAVAAVYGYFLIFAQFSLVEILRADGVALTAEKALLGVMAAAGIGGGFLIAWRGVSPRAVRVALALAGCVAALATMVSGTAGFVAIAVATGGCLGVATVGLSALLPAWCGVAWVGLGTGLGYAVCNVPAVFLQAPAVQAWIAAGLAWVGVIALPSAVEWRVKVAAAKVFPMWGAVVMFTALVWMDSAAFFIIQHSADLKSGTWGEPMLWRNALMHLSMAGAAGLWLARGGARYLPGTAWLVLAVAALTVNADDTRGIAGWFYPVGVSLYSAALVAWPGWFSAANDTRTAAWRAAWLFAIAGWFGSANGIGMAETLERVPPVFVAGAGVLVAAVMLLTIPGHWRAALAVAGVVMVCGFGNIRNGPELPSAADRGRHVYVSEGCIHCHSQYVRPDSADEKIWGPPRDMKSVLQGEPVLIGNRRQGPDLTNVGARRSEAWLREHFIDPRALVPGSSMPSYAHLFDDKRGGDLVGYLKQSGVSATAAVMTRAAAWKPERGSGQDARATGKALFAAHCAVCHGDGGHGNGPLSGKFLRPPANLVDGPFLWTAAGGELETRVARVIKFGITGTDMPGHEVMTDAQVIALSEQVLKLRSDH